MGTGNVQWQRTYGGAYGDAALSIWQTSDGGYIVTGFTDQRFENGSEVFVLKLGAACPQAASPKRPEAC